MRKQERGLMLLELLVTLALLTILTPPLLNLIITGSQILTTADQQTKALYLAREALEKQRLCVAESSGEWEEVEGFAGFRRQVVINKPSVEDAPPQLKEIMVTVGWQQKGEDNELALVTWQVGGDTMGQMVLH